MDKAVLAKVGKAIAMAALTVAVTTVQALSQENLIETAKELVKSRRA